MTLTFEQRLRARGLIAAPEPPPPVTDTFVIRGDAAISRYLTAAVTGEANRLATTTQGSRNHTLNAAAYSLGGLVAGAGLDEALVVTALTDAATACGLTAHEIPQTLRSGLDAGKKKPRGVPDPTVDYHPAPVFDVVTGEFVAPEQAKPALVFQRLSDVARDVDAAGDPEWLFTSVWPGDAYGVLAAEDKAGKSWGASDAAISVASGTPWMTTFDCPHPGPVLLFFGEGGQRNLVRRMRAIAADRQIDVDDLDIRVCDRVPHLSDAAHLALVHAELQANPARLAIVDPLYLAARGSSGSDLYAMGEALEGIQHVCQAADTALIVVTHFNKTGEGRGAKRITGVGPGAWGRVLGTAHVEHRETDETTRATDVILGWEFIGGEIPDTSIHVRRRVWADDPDKLGSPLNYRLSVVQDDFVAPSDGPSGLSPSAKRVRRILAEEREGMTLQQIGDKLAEEGRPLTRRTIQNAVDALGDAIDSLILDTRGTRSYSLVDDDE